MIYDFIYKKSNEWYSSKECTVKSLIDYIISTNKMRDAQVEAIKIYLFLKIYCNNQPLYDLFISGVFNSLDIFNEDLSQSSKEYLLSHIEARAFYEYLMTIKNDNKKIEQLYRIINNNPQSLNYDLIFRELFYNVSYTDYLFSLPMGAGKTYLMAAFIYLDLYFAMNEPDNNNFAHNFIIFAPSGLKSSVIPSLKTIQNFDPSWVIPEPAASTLKNLLMFEVLDENKSNKKSNRVRNPNVQKIAIHQPFCDLFGLVIVTNAEKVILDRVHVKQVDSQITWVENDELTAEEQSANELRSIIGRIPALSIFIDEVHHAVDSNIKLRAVVNKWIENNNTINNVVGFSGTPFLKTKEKINITSNISIVHSEISNIVYYYPLKRGIGNFLKKPKVYISDNNNRLDIIENGLRLFLDKYKDKVYEDGTVAKIAIYNPTIEILEEQVYPLVRTILTDYKLEPDLHILKRHNGNKKYKKPVDSEYLFSMLDNSTSKIKVILLVEIAKEGWDCKSLTGVIMPQEGDCKKTTILQTSCRCLRQVTKNSYETAIIYLNDKNAQLLNDELLRKQNITISELESCTDNEIIEIKYYDRRGVLKLPPVNFYQLRVQFDSYYISDSKNILEDIIMSTTDAKNEETIIKEAEIQDGLRNIGIDSIGKESGNEIASYSQWLNLIVKEGFGMIAIEQLNEYESDLKKIFDEITFEKDNVRYYSSKYKQRKVRTNIRMPFYDIRESLSKTEIIEDTATLLNISNFKSSIFVNDTSEFVPEKGLINTIIKQDSGEYNYDEDILSTIRSLENLGKFDMVEQLKRDYRFPDIMNARTYHYMPYKLNKGFEMAYFDELLQLDVIKNNELEVYYNGDRGLTDFKIKCYEYLNGKYNYLGVYTPDFLILKRELEKIYKIIIIETKGEIYGYDPKFIKKRKYVETEFLKMNNNNFGKIKFDFLYLDDTLSFEKRVSLTKNKINEFILCDEKGE